MLREQSSSFNTYIPVILIRKGDKAESSVWTCAKSDIEQCFDLGFAATVKTFFFFSWTVHFYPASSAKLDNFKADKTRMVEI